MKADAIFEARRALSDAQSAVARLKAIVDRIEADSLALAPKPKKGTPPAEVRLDGLQLSHVTYRRLATELGPDATVADILAEGEKGLRRIPWFGHKGMSELIRKLDELGFDLPYYRTKGA